MESFQDLWGRLRTGLPGGKVLDEKAELRKFFETQINMSRGKREPLASAYIGQRLAHFKLHQLYTIKSEYMDRLNRQGRATADKYWWWVTETKPINNEKENTTQNNRGEATH